MKKLFCLLPVVLFFWMTPALAGCQQEDSKALKAKAEKKIAEMKAAGATDEEIKKFVAEFKKKQAAQLNGDSDAKISDAALQEKLDRKIADMKAAGASDEEIKKTVLEFKKKVAEMKAKAEKKENKSQSPKN